MTVDGQRRLDGDDADLVCRAVATMLSELVAETTELTGPRKYGIDWFDQWEPEQRIWLLERVATAFLTDQPVPAPAAIWEATVDAIFQHVFESLVTEIDADGLYVDDSSHAPDESDSWRQAVIRAFEQNGRRLSPISTVTDDKVLWRRLVMQIADMILGVTTYHAVESYRDGDVSRVGRFLEQKGLPADFLEQIPPLVSQTEAAALISQIRRLLAQRG